MSDATPELDMTLLDLPCEDDDEDDDSNRPTGSEQEAPGEDLAPPLEPSVAEVPYLEPEAAPRPVSFDSLSRRDPPAQEEPTPQPPPPPVVKLEDRIAAIRACMPSQLDLMFQEFTATSGLDELPPVLVDNLPKAFVQLFDWWADVWPAKEVNPVGYSSLRRFLLLCDALRVRSHSNLREKIDALTSVFDALARSQRRVRVRPAIEVVLYLTGESALPLREDSFDLYVQANPGTRPDALLAPVYQSFLDWLLVSNEDTGLHTDTSENAQVLKKLQAELSSQFMSDVALPSIAYLKAMDSVAMTVDDLTTAFESDRSGSEQLLATALRLVEANNIVKLLMANEPALAAIYLDIVKQTILSEGVAPVVGEAPTPYARSLASDPPGRKPGPVAPSQKSQNAKPPRNAFTA